MTTTEAAEVTAGAPRPWSLGGDPPAPQEAPTPVKNPRVKGLATHVGTDPHGRAIGPAEDHTKPKLDAEGLSVPEAAAKRRKDARKAKTR